MIKRSLFLGLILLILFDIDGHSQQVKVESSIDTNNVLIGEPIKIGLQVISKPPAGVVMPSIEDSIGNLEVLSISKIDTIAEEDYLELKQTYEVTSFDAGSYEVPPFTVMYEKKNMQDVYPAKSNFHTVNFATVEIDTTADIKDVKAPLEIPLTLAEFIWYIVGGVLITAAIVIGYILWKRRTPAIYKDLDYDPKIPPHVLALEALQSLKEEKLWQKGQIKLYYIKLTEIIRLYIERRFEILALEMISGEIVDRMRNTEVSSDQIDKLEDMFRNADLVKFAKMEPPTEKNTEAMHIAEEFVRATIPVMKKEHEEEKNV